MRPAIILILAFFLFGCRTTSQFIAENNAFISGSGNPVYFLDETKRDAKLQKFLESHKEYTEIDKIQYLLETMRESEFVFFRNGMEYTGGVAAKWLRWKMQHRQYKESPILTAYDFVNRVCIRSNTTGVPYEVIMSDKSHEKLQVILSYELQLLETAIKARVMQEAIQNQDSALTQGHSSPAPAPILQPKPA